MTQATFAYDADELRIRKTNSATSAVTHYVYDADGQLIAEMDGATGNPVREYIWLGALPIGYVDRLGASGASRLFFIHADHLARPQKITDASRAIVWDGVFAPFGEIHSITGSIVNVLMFPGQIYDPETGLAQNWHRDYDANIGRYLESDPIGLEGGINTYAYVAGNPLVYTDPNGRQSSRLLLDQAKRLVKDFWDMYNKMSKSDTHEYCTRLYVRCVQEGWGGDWTCGQCHFYCTGINEEWPFEHCSPDAKACYAKPGAIPYLLPERP